MASFNQVNLLGNCTRDIEVQYTQTGTPYANFSIAVNDRRKKNDEWVDEVSFIDLTAFGKTAEVAGNYLAKGKPVLITGRIKQDTWEKDGEKRSKLKVIIDRLQLIAGKDGGGQSGGQPSSQQQSGGIQAPADDDIPF